MCPAMSSPPPPAHLRPTPRATTPVTSPITASTASCWCSDIGHQTPRHPLGEIPRNVCRLCPFAGVSLDSDAVEAGLNERAEILNGKRAACSWQLHCTRQQGPRREVQMPFEIHG